MNEASHGLTLYTDAFWTSPYVFSVFVTLKEKGLAFTQRPVALQSKEQHDPAYRDRALTGRVPALSHGDFWLAESQAIVEYLEDAFPATPRVLPEDTRERARARQILAWIRSDLLPLREERPTSTMFYARADKPMTTAALEAAKKLLHVADLLIPAGATSLFGSWCLADSDLSFMLHRLILNGHDVPPKIRTFAETQWTRPSVQAFVTHERSPYVPY